MDHQKTVQNFGCGTRATAEYSRISEPQTDSSDSHGEDRRGLDVRVQGAPANIESERTTSCALLRLNLT